MRTMVNDAFPHRTLLRIEPCIGGYDCQTVQQALATIPIGSTTYYYAVLTRTYHTCTTSHPSNDI